MLKFKGKRLIVIAAVYTAALIYLSLADLGGHNPMSFPHADKLEHALAYAGFFWLWTSVFRWIGLTQFMLKAAFCALCFGIILEICQLYLTNTRSFDPLDMFANACGIGVSFLIMRMTTNK